MTRPTTVSARPEAVIATTDPRDGRPVCLAFHRVDAAHPPIVLEEGDRAKVVEG